MKVIETQTYWPGMLVRATGAAVGAVLITFTANHSSALGLLVLGIICLFWGPAELVATGLRRRLSLTGVFNTLAAVLSLALTSKDLGFFTWLTVVWAVVNGILDLLALPRSPSWFRSSWIFFICLSFGLAAVLVAIPPTPLVNVGIFGAYAAIAAVFLTITAFSLARPVEPQTRKAHD